MHTDGDTDFLYQLDIHRTQLCRLCVTWQAQVQVVPCAYPMSTSWGPSELELNEAAQYEVTESVDMGMDTGHLASEAEDDGDFDYGFHDPDSDAEGDLLEAAETAAMTDAYHALDEDVIYGFNGPDMDTHTILFPAQGYSPKKRKEL